METDSNDLFDLLTLMAANLQDFEYNSG